MSAVVLITGASTGIGRLAAETAVCAGHTVYAGMRDRCMPLGRRTSKPARRFILSRYAAVVMGCCLIPASYSNLYAQTCTAVPSGITNWWPFDGPGAAPAQTPDIAGALTTVSNSTSNPDFSAGFVGKSSCGSAGLASWAVRSSNLLNLLRGDFTFEFWTSFNASAQSGTHFLEAVGWQLYGVNRWFAGFEASSISGNTANGNLVVGVLRPEAAGGELPFVTTPFFPTAGSWYHIAFTRNGNVYSIYVNGSLLASATSSIDPGPPDPSLATLNLIAAGCIDEASLYGRALTANELQAIVAAGAAGKCRQLSISTSSIPNLYVGAATNFQLSAVLYTAPVTWTVTSGTLPPGVQLDSSGKLSGQPTHAGTYSFSVSARDASGAVAQKALIAEVVLAPPPPPIRIHKTGTVAIPGRTVDYFILVENAGSTVATNVSVQELIDPWFTFLSADPSPSDITRGDSVFPAGVNTSYDALIKWTIPELDPGKFQILTYRVNLDRTFPIGQEVRGEGCLTPKKANSCLQDFLACEAAAAVTCFVAVEAYPVCISLGTAACAILYTRCILAADEEPGPGGGGGGCDTHKQPAVGSADPNEKRVIAKDFVLPDQILAYPIHFENVGTAEARDVFVSDTLDPNLDLSTLKVSPSDQATIDVNTRTVKWNLAGRNLQPGEGDTVLFSIRPKPGLSSGTVIRNTATIQFESFQPMNTNETTTTIDTTRPSCHMMPLPARTTSASIPLSWTGTDAVGAISNYSVWASTNSGAFAPVVLNTSDTNATFAGEAGKTYGFLCVATDVAGNVESKRDVAEVTTTVITSVPGDVNGDGVVDCQDIAIVRAAFGSHTGDARFDARADVVMDGVIDVRDLAFVSQKLPVGTRCQ